MVTFILCKFVMPLWMTFSFTLLYSNYAIARSKWGKAGWPLLLGICMQVRNFELVFQVLEVSWCSDDWLSSSCKGTSGVLHITGSSNTVIFFCF